MDTLEQQLVPKRREAVDCFNCSTSRRACDRTRHRCATCAQGSQICQGYPRELQWLTGVTSRGKQKGRSLSIKHSSQGWESTTPTNLTFVFKPEKPHRPRRHGSQISSARSSHKTGTQQPEPVAVGEEHRSQRPSPVASEEPSLISATSPYPTGSETATNFCDSVLPFDGLFSDFQSSWEQDPNSLDDSLFTLPLTPSPFGQSEGCENVALENESSLRSPPSVPSSPFLGPSQLLTFYDAELCALPVTFDFSANPFRCKTEGSPHLLHAVLAISIQHISRMSDSPFDSKVLSSQMMTYKTSAIEMTSAALQALPNNPIRSVLDSIIVLFALDTLTSSVGPWTHRLRDAYNKIEALGGVDAFASSPYSRAQLSMFVWWDCVAALLSRSEPVLPASYFAVALSLDDDPTWDVHVLSGVPRELFQFFRELIQLANEKEQVSKMKYAKFDTTRVLELEHVIKEYTVADCIPHGMSAGTGDSDETVHNWHDYYNASHAWKYALLLYLTRVLKWDRTSHRQLPEATSLSRWILDSIRSCRPTSSLRKQLLFPLFLAGSEAMDSYSRTFVKEYCEDWYRNCRYSMFMEALVLQQKIWSRKDSKRDDFSVWWGDVIGCQQPQGSGVLLG